MIDRPAHFARVRRLLRTSRVVAILGPRQSGKTTLARQLFEARKGPGEYFDLELPEDQARLGEPMLALERVRGLVVIDEIHHRPGLFPVLRVLADRPRSARFLILGSAAPDLLKQGSETLAGRIAFHELPGFALAEVGGDRHQRLWLRGGLPRAFLARSEADSLRWRRDYVRTFLERDLPGFGISVAPATMRRFWSMLAHYHGQIWNASQCASSFSASDNTVRRYLDLLTGTLVIRQLQPWHENIGKRQVRSPKIYFRDSGLLHVLLGAGSLRDLEVHPKLGASWEGFGLESVITQLEAEPEECYFWATHSGAELDLLIVRGRKRIGFEFKRTDAPKATKSMHIALEDLGLSSLLVVHGGRNAFPLASKIEAVPVGDIAQRVRSLR